jgi:DNA-binding beta-propeller fold protein YncE
MTFASINIVGSWPSALFINTNDSVFVANRDTGDIVIWDDVCDNLPRIISTNLSSLASLFVTNDDEIFISGGSSTNSRVERWMLNGTQLSSPMVLSGCSPCYSLFVDISNNLYCSQQNQHQVVRNSLINPSSTLTIVAGTGVAGSGARMLNSPAGIFVTINLDLYVADYYNNRVQLFRSGQSNATTVVVSSGLVRPTGVTVDGLGNVFIVDQYNHRVLRSGPSGYQCVTNCGYGAGASSYQLYYPSSMSFDSQGNILVVDSYNARIQKFIYSPNSCSKWKTIKRLSKCIIEMNN